MIPFISQMNRPGCATEAAPVVFLFGSVQCMAGAGWPSESHRYGKGLCVVLGDKAVLVRAFVRTLNHQSWKKRL